LSSLGCWGQPPGRLQPVGWRRPVLARPRSTGPARSQAGSPRADAAGAASHGPISRLEREPGPVPLIPDDLSIIVFSPTRKPEHAESFVPQCDSLTWMGMGTWGQQRQLGAVGVRSEGCCARAPPAQTAAMRRGAHHHAAAAAMRWSRRGSPVSESGASWGYVSATCMKRSSRRPNEGDSHQARHGDA
jgi:hypothetical protein